MLVAVVEVVVVVVVGPIWRPCLGCLLAVLHWDLHAFGMLNGSITLGFACSEYELASQRTVCIVCLFNDMYFELIDFGICLI